MALRRYARIAPEEEYRELPETPNWFNFNKSSEGIETPSDQYGTFEGSSTRAALYAAPEDYVTEGDTAIPVDMVNVAIALFAALGGYEYQKATEVEDYDPESQTDILSGTVVLGDNEENFYMCIESHTPEAQFNPPTGENWEDKFELYEMQYEHIFKPDDFLPSMQVAIGKDEFEHRFKGMMVDTLTLEYEDGFLVAGLSWIGADDEKHELADIEVSDLPQDVVTALMGTFHRDTEDFTGKVEQFEMTLNNNLSVGEYVPASQRFPVNGVPQELELNVELTVSFEDESELEEYWGGEEGPTVEVTETDFSVAFEQDGKQLEIALPRVVCQNHTANISGRSKVEQTLEYEALVEHESGNPLVITLLNGVDEYDFAIEEEE